MTLCLYHLSHTVAVKAGEILLEPDVVTCLRLSRKDEQDAWTLFVNRPDKTYSFTDCASFVLMRRLGLRQVASLDADFEREGFELYKP